MSISSSAAAGIALDLTSTVASVSSNRALGKSAQATIDLGNTAQTITKGMKLTPAEYLAVREVLGSGKQSLILSTLGNAIGGTFTVPSLRHGIASLTIPNGVTGIDTAANLSIAGNLVNSGKLFAVSTVAGRSTDTISATNITNQASGIITSVIPSSGIAGFNFSTSPLSLSLAATNSIINNGGIFSSANLTMSAGAGITNGAGATIQAAGAVNLSAPTITNLGTITANAAALTVSTSTLINSGLMQSLQSALVIGKQNGATLDVDFQQLAQLNAKKLQVGSADFTSDIVLNSDCNDCLGDIYSLAFDTQGSFTSTGATLRLSPVTSLSINAASGIAAGNILGGKGITMTTAGNLSLNGNIATNGGVSAVAGGDLLINKGVAVTATGGNILLDAGGDVTISGAQLSSTSSLAGQAGSAFTSYSGGQIAIVAGNPSLDVGSVLSGLVSSRTASKELVSVTGGSLSADNTVSETGGSILSLVFSNNGTKSLTGNIFNLNGGVVYIDPPATSNVTITDTSINAAGPQLAATPVPSGGTTAGQSPIALPAQSLHAESASTLSLQAPVNTITGHDASSGNSALIPSDSTPVDGIAKNASPAVFCAPLVTLKQDQPVDDNSWIVAANACQPFSFEGPDGSIIIGTGPATFAPAPRHTLLLKEGKLLIIASRTVIIVRTPMCGVIIPINSAATVDYDAGGVTRVTALAGGKASVSINRAGETMILSANAGEQLVLAEGNVNQSQIACMPSVPNQRLSNWMVELNGLRGFKFAFDSCSMVAQEGLLNCSLGCFSKVQQALIDEIRRAMLTNPGRELRSTRAAPDNVASDRVPSKGNRGHLMPVSFSGSASVLDGGLALLKAGTATLHYSDRAGIILKKDKMVSLTDGEMLVSATSATKVAAGMYSVAIDAGCVAMIANHRDHIIVRNLYSRKDSPVTVVGLDGKVIGAQTGQEIIVGSKGYSFAKVLSEEPIGRRRIRHVELGAHTSVITSEVSLVSLLENTDLLSNLARSRNSEDKAIVEKLLKTAVALSLITQSHGAYSIVGR